MFKNFDLGDVIIIILIVIITTLLVLGGIGVSKIASAGQQCLDKGMVYDSGICVKDASKN